MLYWFAPLIIVAWCLIWLFSCLSDNMPNGIFRHKFDIWSSFLVIIVAIAYFCLTAVIDYQELRSSNLVLTEENEFLSAELDAALSQVDFLSDCIDDAYDDGYNAATHDIVTHSNQVPSSSSNSTKTSSYIGNQVTKELHRSDCSYVPSPDNRVSFETIGYAIVNGYDLCGHCFS